MNWSMTFSVIGGAGGLIIGGALMARLGMWLSKRFTGDDFHWVGLAAMLVIIVVGGGLVAGAFA